MKLFARAVLAIAVMAASAHLLPAQAPLQLAQPQGSAGAPLLVTLDDALDRAKELDGQYLSAVYDAQLAAEDRVQARSAMLPNVSGLTQYLNTQGNGVFPSGRFVTN